MATAFLCSGQWGQSAQHQFGCMSGLLLSAVVAEASCKSTTRFWTDDCILALPRDIRKFGSVSMLGFGPPLLK